MANPSLGDTCNTLHSDGDPTVATSGSALMPGPPSNLLSRTDASAMAQFSMELRELEAVSALSTLSQGSETQLDFQGIMHELSVDSEVTFRKVLGSAEIFPTRPGIDPFEDTRPLDTTSDRSSLQLTPLTVSPFVIAPGTALGLASSTHTSTPTTLQNITHILITKV